MSFLLFSPKPYIAHSQRLEQVLDFEYDGVSQHLGQIADSMYEWEGAIAEQLGLLPADVASIKLENSKFSLQVYVL